MVSTVITNRGELRHATELRGTIHYLTVQINKMVPELQCRICKKSFDNRKLSLRFRASIG
jgi:hypothetical protein